MISFHSCTLISLFSKVLLISQSSALSEASSSFQIFLPPGVADKLIIVYEDEFSSLIANTLSSYEYKERLDSYLKLTESDEIQTETNHEISTTIDTICPEDSHMKRRLLSKINTDIVFEAKYQRHINGITLHMNCISYFALQFHALRYFYGRTRGNHENHQEFENAMNEDFILSLIRCNRWDAKGGKSGSTFSKTHDDRYILKEVSSNELKSFLGVALLYFEYQSNALFEQMPTILAKIYGVYSISIEKPSSKISKHLIVMENIFYNQSLSKIYDLKGSKRSRYIAHPENDAVLLDENLLEVMFTSPICVDEHSKAKLQAAIWNDTLFLSSLGVMDYSLLCGIHSTNNLVTVGIIDFIRQYTWDKHLETWVKSSGIMGGKGKIPTVISPKQYKSRFREAMNIYFVMVPNKYTNFRLKKKNKNKNKNNNNNKKCQQSK